MKKVLDRAGSPATSREGATPDDFYLERAIDLAWNGAGRTRSNPLVGAVVVRDGAIVGEGYHEAFGFDHAEIVAIERAGDRARGATLYSTLEPCIHYGKTPPCVDRVLSAGVRRVVACTLDPDPRVDGRGVAALAEAGVEVDLGRRAEEAIVLNLPYFKEKLGLGPAVSLKMAVTLDGRIASGHAKRDLISGLDARVFVHRLRASHAAVMVGINTVVVDRPRLDCRLLESVSVPVPVVLDARLRFPEPPAFGEGERGFIVLSAPDIDAEKAARLARTGGEVIAVPGAHDRIDVAAAVAALFSRGLRSVLVEGGGGVFASFMDADAWDALHLIVSPAVFGARGVGLSERRIESFDGSAAPAGLSRLGRDVRLSFLNKRTLDTMRPRLLGGVG